MAALWALSFLLSLMVHRIMPILMDDSLLRRARMFGDPTRNTVGGMGTGVV